MKEPIFTLTAEQHVFLQTTIPFELYERYNVEFKLTEYAYVNTLDYICDLEKYTIEQQKMLNELRDSYLNWKRYGIY